MSNHTHRDIRCASDVASMVALGKFEKEFIAYGTATKTETGEVYYYAASNEERLQKYVDAQKWKGNYFTPVVSTVKRSLVPSGLEDDIVQACKQVMLGEMKAQYESVDYFNEMQPFFDTAANDNAYPILLDYKERIEGYFEDQELQLFLNAVQIAYEGKVLSEAKYQELLAWHQYIRRQMEDDPIVAENLERTLYGFVYYEDGKQKLAYDAQELCIIHQHNEKIMKGLTVGPMMHKTYWFQQFKLMKEVRDSFCDWLKAGQNEEYFALLEQIKTVPGVIDEQALNAVGEKFASSQMATNAWKYYQYVWNKK